MQPRTHALSDPVSESFAPRGRSCGRERTGNSRCRLIFKVRGNDGRPVVVVARVEDQADGVPHPFRRLHGAEFVQDQNIGFEYRPKHIQLGGLDRRIVGILNLLQKLAIIVKKAGNTTVQNELFNDPYREMCLPRTELANDQQSLITAWIALLSEIRSEKMGLCQRRMRPREVRVVVPQLAMFIPPGNPSRCQHRLRSLREANETRPPLHNLLRLCTLRLFPCKSERLSSCVHPVKDAVLLWRVEENHAKPPPKAHFGPAGCKTGFRRGFSQLTFPVEGAKYERSGFPNSALARFPP